MPGFVGPSPKHLNHVLILSLNLTNYCIILAVLTIVHALSFVAASFGYVLSLVKYKLYQQHFSQLCDQITTL